MQEEVAALNDGIKQISFCGKLSYDDIGVYLVKGGFEPPPPRIVTTKVPYCSGGYDFSRISGSLIYDDRTGSYTFFIKGNDQNEAESIKADLLEWLFDSVGDLIDESYDGYAFTDVSCIGIDPIEYIGDKRRAILLTAMFKAAPLMRSVYGRLIDCLTFTPTENANTYLFATYTPPAVSPGFYWLVRMVAAGGSGGYTGMTVTFGTEHSVSDKYAEVTIPANGGTKWYLAPKTISGYSVSYAVRSGCVKIGEDDKYIYLFQQNSADLVLRLRGFGYTTMSESQVTEAIRHADWRNTQHTQYFTTTTIPGTDHMRLVGESDFSVTVKGMDVDVTDFSLPVPSRITVSGSKSDPIALQYCTVKERL